MTPKGRAVFRRYLFAGIVGLAAMEVLILWRGYPLRLALLAGLAVAALAYYALVALANVRRS